jgi:SAM-dependent methyltransferase
MDIGCGTGVVSQAILAGANPATVVAMDPYEGFAGHARRAIRDNRISFVVGSVDELPIARGVVDIAVSGLVLNFLDHPRQALLRLAAACSPGGIVAGYVWDYAGRMEMLRYFWDAAAALDPQSRKLDEGVRFPICQPDALECLFLESGLTCVEGFTIDVPTRFSDFDDFWAPFQGGVGPAPGYVGSLQASQREALKRRLQDTLPAGPGGEINLIARAWAVKGMV